MEPSDTPYVFGDEPPQPPSHDPEGRDVVIIDGEAMTYRSYLSAKRESRRLRR